MYALGGIMLIVLLGVVGFFIAVLLLRWILGISKIIDLLTTIEANTNHKPAPHHAPEVDPLPHSTE